ncbi:reverse transcriptase [Gossypium australe]|uniref:Reverse transcriptase n=1 Tax=Gossypium australe TaxID=47621 RepID=A0A5B6WKT6_9ROSI|nr:reverse transcriptase [Gossypium australe]
MVLILVRWDPEGFVTGIERKFVEVNDTESGVKWRLTGFYGNLGERGRRGRRRSERQMLAFRSALEDCNLTDLGFKGHWFTWERGRFSSTNIREHLDRGVATLNWLELFPSAQVDHLTHSFPDHCPILLNTMDLKVAARTQDSSSKSKHTIEIFGTFVINLKSMACIG